MSMFFENIRMALASLLHNKMRTFLTVLGVIIGIMSIISLMTLVQGATDMVGDQLVSAGANKLTVSTFGDQSKAGLTEKDLLAFEVIDNVDYVSANVSAKLTASTAEHSVNNVVVKGIDGNYFRGASDVLLEGRLIYPLDIENQTTVGVISSGLAEKLFGEMSPLGHTVKVNGISFTIVGVIDSMNPSVGFNDTVLMPRTTASNALNLGLIRTMDVFLLDTEISSETQSLVEDELFTIFNENKNAYSVFDMQVFMDMFGQIMGTMNQLLVGIAAISLLVGGIGIMNMMLVSVSERTNEIGLRKALGAKPHSILLQFVMESIFISMLGGIIGTILGIVGSFAAGAILNVTPTVTVGVVALAFGFSAMVGLVFGIVPARRASKLNPIDALRSN